MIRHQSIPDEAMKQLNSTDEKVYCDDGIRQHYHTSSRVQRNIIHALKARILCKMRCRRHLL